ncbi:MAG TPA: TIM-barrel domain-containing protein, partial [Solimonas sp.]
MPHAPLNARAWFAVLAMAGACVLGGCGSSTPPDDPATGAIVRDGAARFTVLTPTLIRLEYADDERFEDGATQTVLSRELPVPAFRTHVENGERIIETDALTLHYRRGSGAFGDNNLRIELTVGNRSQTAQPQWGMPPDADNLGGWRRALDNEQAAVPLHDGLLSRRGWFLLDDSVTVLLTAAAPGFAPRPAHGGAYQDGYFFGYGHDYARGLRDLRALTGPAPLLPRKAFGVWFSRYWAYSATELETLVAQFRAQQVPLDTLSLDTDWKRVHNAVACVAFDLIAGARPGDPCSWNGWDWNRTLFPDPQGFVDWAHAQGLALALNVHPSIDTADPQYPIVQAQAGELAADSSLPPCALLQADPLHGCKVFDWTDPAQLAAYFALHEPIAALGVDFWWLDWCCDGSHADAPGLSADTWINAQYAQFNAARGRRWPAFSRIGGSQPAGDAVAANGGAGAFAEHRTTMHFTGDTCGTWEMLAFEARMTVAEGNIGLPYVTHDIGSFLGPPLAGGVCNGTLGHTAHLPDDLYLRWLQFGVFQPLLRLHSSHGDRLPWDYDDATAAIAADFLRLRERLVPQLYSLARASYDDGLPIARGLYLQWPEHDAAYTYPSEYLLGDALLVATVAAAGDPATVDVWIPPGDWTNYFTGEVVSGPRAVTLSVPLARYPLFARAGAIVVTQPDLPTSSAGPQDGLTVTAWSGADGRFDLYEDAGEGLAYRDGAYRRTAVTLRAPATDCTQLR